MVRKQKCHISPHVMNGEVIALCVVTERIGRRTMPEVTLIDGTVIHAASVLLDTRSGPWVEITTYPNHDGYIPQNSNEHDTQKMTYHEDQIKKVLWGVEEI